MDGQTKNQIKQTRQLYLKKHNLQKKNQKIVAEVSSKEGKSSSAFHHYPFSSFDIIHAAAVVVFCFQFIFLFLLFRVLAQHNTAAPISGGGSGHVLFLVFLFWSLHSTTAKFMSLFVFAKKQRERKKMSSGFLFFSFLLFASQPETTSLLACLWKTTTTAAKTVQM